MVVSPAADPRAAGSKMLWLGGTRQNWIAHVQGIKALVSLGANPEIGEPAAARARQSCNWIQPLNLDVAASDLGDPRAMGHQGGSWPVRRRVW